MTKNSRSEFKRPYAVCPMRVAVDRKLNESDLRVLIALCGFTNRSGVCWPSMATLMDLTDLKSRTSISRSITKLKRLKYVRQLEPKDYQTTATGWKNNRYQVLWEEDMAMPSYEEVHIAKPLQLVDDQDEVPESIGGLGDVQSFSHTSAGIDAQRLAAAFVRGVAAGTGQVVLAENVINLARQMPDTVTPAQLEQATLELCRSNLAERRGVPSFKDVRVSLNV